MLWNRRHYLFFIHFCAVSQNYFKIEESYSACSKMSSLRYCHKNFTNSRTIKPLIMNQNGSRPPKLPHVFSQFPHPFLTVLLIFYEQDYFYNIKHQRKTASTDFIPVFIQYQNNITYSRNTKSECGFLTPRSSQANDGLIKYQSPGRSVNLVPQRKGPVGEVKASFTEKWGL